MSETNRLWNHLANVLSAPPGLERRTMHRRFFFWITLVLLLLALVLLGILSGSSFWTWPIFAQLAMAALFILLEPHLEARLSPFYRGSGTLAAFADKSQAEWTDLAQKTATAAMTRTLNAVDSIAPDSVTTPHKAPEFWQAVASPAAFPGVMLLTNGDIQIGLTHLSTNSPIRRCVNGVTVQTVRAPESCIRLAREGLVRRVRFSKGQWQIAHELPVRPEAVVVKRPPRFALFLASIIFPIVFGVSASLDYAGDGFSLFVAGFWFVLGAAAGYFHNWRFINKSWRVWSDYVDAHIVQGFEGTKSALFVIANNLFAFLVTLSLIGNLNEGRVRFRDNLIPRASVVASPFVIVILLFIYHQWRRYTGRQTTAETTPSVPRAVVNADMARQIQEGRIGNSSVPVVPWGGLLLPVDRTLSHFALVGTTRSGKTINMRLLMQTAIPNAIAAAAGATNFPSGRALVFDPKTEFVPILRGMGVPESRIKIMNPFDQRGTPWDIAGDTLTPADADNVAEIFVPDAKENEKNGDFFVSTSRDVVSSVFQALHHSSGPRWTLRDFVQVCSDFHRVEAILSACPSTQHVIPIYSKTPETYGNILASLQTIVKNFRVVAACWHRATEKPLSMNQWMQSNSVLVLGHDDTKTATFSTLNRCLIHKISNAILDPANLCDPAKERTWLFLDETRDLGKLRGIRELLTRGAGKGCTVVLGFQSINGMKAVFGDHEASEIVGQCDNIGVFRLGNDHDTAKWAAELIGKHERTEYMQTESRNERSGVTLGTNQQLQERFIVRPEALQDMRATDREHGLNGIFISKAYGVIHASHYGISGDELFDSLLDRGDSTEAALLRVDDAVQLLAPWTAQEQARILSGTNDEPPTDWMDTLGRLN